MVKSIAASLLVSAALGSKCPSSVAPICQNLDLSRYTGVWYEQVNSKAFTIDANLKCVTAEYSANDDGTVKVDNKGAQGSRTGEVTEAVGTATVKDLSTCELGVKFSSLQPVAAPYQIWDTDYDTYAIVVSCIPILNALGKSDIWILSRTPKLPQATLDGLLQKLADAGFDYGDMRMQEQESDCSYGVPTSSGFRLAHHLKAKSAAIDLVTFEGDNNWDALVDPVMGGQSVATATIVDQHGVLDGEVKIVPALQAPGFITAQSDVKIDASAAAGGELVMKVRSTTPDYTGFKVSFAASTVNPTFACATGGSSPLGRGCFKSPFTVPAGDDFTEIRIPLSEFSDKWDSATGELTTLCKDDASVCPSADKLDEVQRVAFWGEGKAGQVHIEVDSVAIEAAAQPLKAQTTANLVTFDGAEGTTFTFQELNDPVMGGKSAGTWSLGDGFGIFDGEVVDVPSLQAPGFIKAQASGSFPDVSAFIDGSLVLSVRTTNPEYEGYRVTFVSGATSPSFSCSAGGSLPFSRGCYKQKFSVPSGDDFVDVKIPFNTFSDKWSSATGEQTTTCADDADVCPTANKLAKIQMIELWGEGAGGKVHLEVNSIGAESADGERFVLV